MKINDTTNNNQNYYLNNAKNNADKALQNISAQRALNGTDSANLVIADSLLSQTNSISQGVNNANDAIGILQIADGTLQNLHDGANRLNELSVKMNNAALGTQEKQALRSEESSIKTSMIDSINSASFNGNSIFDRTMNFQTSNSEVSINLNTPNINSIDISDQNSISEFMNSVNSLRGDIGGIQNGLMSGINSSMATVTALKSSESKLQNNDIAKNVSDLKNANLHINFSTLAQAHNIQTLRNQFSTLLG